MTRRYRQNLQATATYTVRGCLMQLRIFEQQLILSQQYLKVYTALRASQQYVLRNWTVTFAADLEFRHRRKAR
jgi:hypothetical protein